MSKNQSHFIGALDRHHCLQKKCTGLERILINYYFQFLCFVYYHIQEVRRNRAVWTPRLDQRDRILRTGESAKQQEQRRKQLDEFQRLKEKNIKRLAIQKQQRIQLRGGIDTDSLFEQQPSTVGEEVVEFLIKTEEVEYKP